MKIIINIIAAYLFFATMVFFTLFARDIRDSTIPNVDARRLTMEEFEFSYISNGEEIISTQNRLAIPKIIYNRGEIFVVTQIYINGELRDIVRRVFLQIGAENESYYEVTGGLFGGELVVFYRNKEFEDGDEVFIVN
jgi:hypothetical protein